MSDFAESSPYDHMSREQLIADIQSYSAKQSRIDSLDLTLNLVTRQRDAMEAALKEWTREQLENEDITEAQAVKLSEIGKFKLSTRYEVTLEVHHTFQIEVELGEDIEETLEDITIHTLDDHRIFGESAELYSKEYDLL